MNEVETIPPVGNGNGQICKPCTRRHHNECADDNCGCGCPKTLVLTGLSATGWKPTPRMDFARWERDMRTMLVVERIAPWAIGDGYNYARSRGSEFEEHAIQVFSGYAEQTVYNYAVIASLFPPEKRRTEKQMTMKHHAVVAKLARTDMTKALQLLREAELNEWSTSALHEEVKVYQAMIAAEMDSPALPAPAVAPDRENPPLDMDWFLTEARRLVLAYTAAMEFEVPGAAAWLKAYETLRK